MQGQKPGKPGRGPVVPQECEECGTGFQIGGPIWTPPLANKAFVQKLLDAVGPESTYAPGIGLATRPRINGMMTAVLEEVETPLYHDLPSMCGILHCTCPPMEQFHAALVNAGYVLYIRLHTNMAHLVGLVGGLIYALSQHLWRSRVFSFPLEYSVIVSHRQVVFPSLTNTIKLYVVFFCFFLFSQLCCVAVAL